MNRRLEELLANLPPDLQREVEDFAAFLANRPRKAPTGWRRAAGAWAQDPSTAPLADEIRQKRSAGREVER